MAMSEIGEMKAADDRRSKLIGVYVGMLATLLAFCTLGGGNAAKDAVRANIEAANQWAFFQAKNTRRTVLSVAADDLGLLLASNPGMPDEAKKAIDAKIRAYRADVARFTSDKERNEGLDELFVKAKDIEKERDEALRRDPYFDLAQALLQIAIVLASVALLANANFLIWFSLILGSLGTLLMINGFTLFAKLPFLG